MGVTSVYHVDFKKTDSVPKIHRQGRKRDGSFDAAVQASHDLKQPYEAQLLDEGAAQAVLMKIRRTAQYLILGVDSAVRPNDDGTVTLTWCARERRKHKEKVSAQEQSLESETEAEPLAEVSE